MARKRRCDDPDFIKACAQMYKDENITTIAKVLRCSKLSVRQALQNAGVYQERVEKPKSRSIKKPKNELYKVMKRKCMKCGDDFKSEWKGNRICPSCKLGSEYRTWTSGNLLYAV